MHSLITAAARTLWMDYEWRSRCGVVHAGGRSSRGLADGKHNHDGHGPLDHGSEKRWGKNRPINHDSGFSLRRSELSSCDKLGPDIER
jgi:hypothetical protein